ncbi:hypothetical protein ATCC90586_009267 [Pythium insidiosum]|nr:hypothetical protein ATCC90586_009267 [Pythium insidiosum]
MAATSSAMRLLHAFYVLPLLVLVGVSMSVHASVIGRSGLVAVSTPDAVRQVAFDGKTVCLATRSQGAVCGAASSTDGGVASWPTQLFTSNATWVAIGGDMAWVLDEWNMYHFGPLGKTSGWSDSHPAHSHSLAVATDGGILCEIAINSQAYCSYVADGSGKVFASYGIQTRSLDVFGTKVVGVASTGEAYAKEWTNTSWTNVALGDTPTRLRAIATDGAFTCIIKNSTEAVMCMAPNIMGWQLIGARFSQIALRAGRLYGVASNGTLWTTKLELLPEGSVDRAALSKDENAAEATAAMNPEPTRSVFFTQFELVPSDKTLTQISYDGTQLCGLTSGDSVAVCTPIAKGKPLEWRSFLLSLRAVAVAKGRVWGVTRANQPLWTESNSSSTTWSPVTATWWTVATDGKILCGIEPVGNTPRCATKNILASPATFYDTVNLEDVGVADGVIFGLTTEANGSLWTTKLQLRASDEPAEPIELLGSSSPDLSPTSPSSSKEQSSGSANAPSNFSKGLSSGAIIALVLGGVVVIGAIGAIVVVRTRRRRESNVKQLSESPRAAGDTSSVVLGVPFDAMPGAKSKGSSASNNVSYGEWMNDASLLPWRIPRRHVLMDYY